MLSYVSFSHGASWMPWPALALRRPSSSSSSCPSSSSTCHRVPLRGGTGCAVAPSPDAVDPDAEIVAHQTSPALRSRPQSAHFHPPRAMATGLVATCPHLGAFGRLPPCRVPHLCCDRLATGHHLEVEQAVRCHQQVHVLDPRESLLADNSEFNDYGSSVC